MKQQIETYQREIEIHKEVEKELAKRSHFCQKVIKRLKQELQEANDGNKKVQNVGHSGGHGQTSQRVGKNNEFRNMAAGSLDDLHKTNDDLINFLEQKLESLEKNMVVKQQEYDALQQEHQSLQTQFN